MVRREMIHRHNTLAWYIRAGLPIDWSDPSRAVARIATQTDSHSLGTVHHVPAFNDISWKLIGRNMKRERR